MNMGPILKGYGVVGIWNVSGDFMSVFQHFKSLPTVQLEDSVPEGPHIQKCHMKSGDGAMRIRNIACACAQQALAVEDASVTWQANSYHRCTHRPTFHQAHTLSWNCVVDHRYLRC
jgi:hypothetical protein